MSNGGLDLGTASATVSFVYDPTGADAFKRSAQEIIALQEQIANGPKASTSLADQFTTAGTAAQELADRARAAGQATQASLQAAGNAADQLKSQLDKLSQGKLFGGKLNEVVALEDKLTSLLQHAEAVQLKIESLHFTAGEARTLAQPNASDSEADRIGQLLAERTHKDKSEFGDPNTVRALAEQAHNAFVELAGIQSQMSSINKEMQTLTSSRALSSAVGQAAIEGKRALTELTIATNQQAQADAALNEANDNVYKGIIADKAVFQALIDASAAADKSVKEVQQRVIDAQRVLADVTQISASVPVSSRGGTAVPSLDAQQRQQERLLDLEIQRAVKGQNLAEAERLVADALSQGNISAERRLELEIKSLDIVDKINKRSPGPVEPKEGIAQSRSQDPEVVAARAEQAARRLYESRLRLANQAEGNLPAAERTYAKSLQLVADEETRVAGNEARTNKVLADREGVLKRVGQAQEHAGQGGFGSALGGFAGDLALGFGVANIGLSIGSTVKDTISQSADLARAAEVSSTAFHAQTEKYGIDSKALLDALRAASHGTIADANLQATAVKSLSEGVGTSIGQLTTLMEIARVRGKEFGFDTATAYEKITQGIEGLLPRQLKQIGIIVNQKTADDEYAASIGKTVTQLSDEEKQQALLNEVLKSQQGILKDTAFAAEDEADRFAKAQAEKQQALTRLGHVTAPLITNAVSSIADILDAATGGTDVSSRDQATINNLIRQSSTIEEATGKVNDYAAALFASVNGMDNLAAIRLGFDTTITPEVFRQVKAQQALDDAAAHTTDALAAQKDAAENLRQKFSDLSGITGFPTAPAPLVGAPSIAGLQRNQDAFDEQHKAAFEKNAADLEQAGITAADQLIAGEAKKNYDLEQLDADHAARIADINQRITDDAQKTQDDISAAETEGRDARAALVQENQQAVADLVARHNLAEQRTTDSQNRQDERTARDQRTADEKTERDFQTGQQKARDTLAQQLHDSDVKYGQDREKLIRNQNEAIEKETKRHNDELVQAAEAAHASRLQGEASFEQQLDGIINHVGGGGIAARKKALDDLKAAKAEADALVAQTGDTQAGAALLAEREKQIIGNRQADTENAQRLRDARRGGALSTGLAKDEISVERDLQNQANAAAIQAIKDGAVDKKKHYDDSLNDQKKANDQALDDLKKSHDDATAKSKADLKQRQDDEDTAHKAQKAATDAARKQAALDLASDRATEQKLRDADYAQQLKQLNDSNDDKVKKFDDAQTKRIAQIAKHGAEQQTALAGELVKEGKQYDAHTASILHNYDVLVQGIKDKIKELEDHLSLTPEDARQAELVKDQQLLADKLGSAFADRYQQYLHHVLGTPLPSDSLGGNVGDNFTPGHDPLLSQSAINSILPGAHEGDTFSALRPGTTGIHQGLDISTGHAGDHILTPVDGQVIYAGAARKGEEWAGNNVQIQTGGSQGPIWYFGHIGKALVAAGDSVKRGQAVAEEGDSGVPGQVHVHLQLRPGPGEAPIDPTQLLNSLAGGTPSAGTARASGAIQRPKNTPSDLAAQAYSGGRLSALQSTAAGVVVGPTYNVSIPVNLAGSTFAPGTSLTQVQNVVTESVNSAFLAFESQQNQQLHHLNTAFPG